MNYQTWDRPNKNKAREITEPLKKSYRTLWMPGEQVIDYGNAIIRGKIGFQGSHILVERDKNIARKIENVLQDEDWNSFSKVHNDELNTLKLDLPLDYAHFDFLGGILEKDAEWIEKELKLEDDSEVRFTFAYAQRNNSFFKQCEYLIRTNKELQEAFNIEQNEKIRNNDLISCYYVIIRSLLRKYEFRTHEQPSGYKDSRTRMVVYHFSEFKKKSIIEYPDILNELKIARSKISTNISITKAICYAKNPIEMAVAKKRRKQHIKNQTSKGRRKTQIVAGFKAQLTKLKKYQYLCGAN